MERHNLRTGIDKASQLIKPREDNGDYRVQLSQPASDLLPPILETILSAPTSRGITYTSGPESR